jgi:hypothetical protein
MRTRTAKLVGLQRRRLSLSLPTGLWGWIDTYSDVLRMPRAQFVAFMLVLARQAHQWGTEAANEVNQSTVGEQVRAGLTQGETLRDAMVGMAEGPEEGQ